MLWFTDASFQEQSERRPGFMLTRCLVARAYDNSLSSAVQ